MQTEPVSTSVSAALKKRERILTLEEILLLKESDKISLVLAILGLSYSRGRRFYSLNKNSPNAKHYHESS